MIKREKRTFQKKTNALNKIYYHKNDIIRKRHRKFTKFKLIKEKEKL